MSERWEIINVIVRPSERELMVPLSIIESNLDAPPTLALMLHAGWEPFGVTENGMDASIWLRRRPPDE